MVSLSVNLNKIALIRNSRGGNTPDVLAAAKAVESFGAHGITIHPRPDQRHATYKDVENLKQIVSTELNVEGYPSKEFIDIVCRVKPHQVTLVPDPPEALTSNAGWNTLEHQSLLTDIVTELKNHGIRTSIFMDTDLSLYESAAATGTDRIELYTEAFARLYPENPAKAIQPYKEAAIRAHSLGLGVNAGHDLNSFNLKCFSQEIPHLMEVSIGHALVSEALYLGLEKTVHLYLEQLK